MKPSEYIERGWCQHVNAKDSAGQAVAATHTEAVCWCIGGALRAWFGGPPTLPTGMIARAENRLCRHLKLADDEDLSTWNDDPKRTQAEVLAALKACDL